VANVDTLSRFIPVFNDISLTSRRNIVLVCYFTIMSVEISAICRTYHQYRAGWRISPCFSRTP